HTLVNPHSLLPPCIFFHHPPAHPALHSFPTRRSSDLARLRGHQAAQRASLSRAGGRARRSDMDAQPDHHCAQVEIAGIQADSVVDRKSTRLNSSHRTISYAVFCLKKKTNIKHPV